jgi:hypothetical protein
MCVCGHRDDEDELKTVVKERRRLVTQYTVQVCKYIYIYIYSCVCVIYCFSVYMFVCLCVCVGIEMTWMS